MGKKRWETSGGGRREKGEGNATSEFQSRIVETMFRWNFLYVCALCRDTVVLALYGLSRREIAETRRWWVFYIYFCSVESLLRPELSQAYGRLLTAAVDALKGRGDKFFSRIMKALIHYVFRNWRVARKRMELVSTTLSSRQDPICR